MDELKKICSIVVTWNGIPWIEKCLNSLLHSTEKTGVIVIDNGSTDDTVSLIKKHFPSVVLIQSPKNLGFGGANNIGIRVALDNHADYIFLLNQDAWVEPETIGTLIAAHKKHPAFGILSPVHLNGAGTALDLYFREYFNRSDRGGLSDESLLHINRSGALVNTTFVNAAAWLLSADCVKTTGGFDPIFFHYGEDDNYAQRALYHGFQIGICTNTRIWHDREDRIRKSTPASSSNPKKDYIIFLNQVCNISRESYVTLYIKRLCRYGLFAFLNIFNKEQFHYHRQMAVRIGGAFFRIRRSRQMIRKTHPAPYL